jgi:hypothetical protein
MLQCDASQGVREADARVWTFWRDGLRAVSCAIFIVQETPHRASLPIAPLRGQKPAYAGLAEEASVVTMG